MAEPEWSLGMSERMGGVEQLVGRRLARSQSLEVAFVGGGDPVRRRPTHGHYMASCCRYQRRLLLLPDQPRTQDRIGVYAIAGTRTASLAIARSFAAGDRRLAHQRYGPKVEGADVHHNPTPGPADQPFLYGHVWVTISLALRHPECGALALPLRAMLYVRKQTMATIPKSRHWPRFATKLQLAARLVEWIVPLLKQAKKAIWIVVDGGYTKRPFLKRALKTGATIVGRLRKDAALRDLPPKLKKGQRRSRGRPRKYGKNKVSLAKRAGQQRGWMTIACTVYGEETTKTYKTFLVTYAPVGGVIRVVLVKEDHGWYAFFCTDPNVSVKEILEAFADRATIDQDFHDVKEVWGSGQQQVRNIWSNLAVYNLNLWMHTLVELWAWNKSHEELCDRSDSPWDDAQRRPSHANRRKAIRRHVLRNELSTITDTWSLPTKIIQLVERLTDLAA